MRCSIARRLDRVSSSFRSRWLSTESSVESNIAVHGDSPVQTSGPLEHLSRQFHILPPVSFLDGSSAPTALQWMRRRGPAMSEGARRKLARQRRMRLFDQDDKGLKRVAASTLLPEGARLLIPKATSPDHEQPGLGRSSAAELLESDAEVVPKRIRQLEAKLAEHVQRRVLHSDAELLVLNKPAGLPVQGGDGIHVSLDSLLPHLRLGSTETPRLVHRLDRNTSGALVVARTVDAAAWLSAAFRQPAEGLQTAAAGQARAFRGAPSIEKHYQAIVEDGPGLQEDRGFIGGRLPGPGGRDAGQRALTKYEVLGRSAEGFAWLALQPVTGMLLADAPGVCRCCSVQSPDTGRRKHQLRKHCAELGAPVVGDGRYGRLRSPAQLRLRQLLKDAPAPEQDADEAELDRLLRCDSHLLLHCCRIVIRRSGNRYVDVAASPSQHMQRVLNVLFRRSNEKRRWTWAEKRAARIEREKVVDKQLKKKWKVARKNRRGRQRSARRHLGIERPFVALDV
ncbi:pseudouridine synthase [Coccomyxa subellipsoidea C-169]|uniref:Pseudouridine synthase n=1 Tax=Coccomyxa subellipsoidea (strain C-169) TaxID=574566 RepID=I0YYU5_COCSC|nr:pseudouridine synthase [Coccomyxa subellipsoidea C-169]EIE23564.1 pseudouridine synthase [Coccomyxa subellipsoidea C-169]|eukprot:XP_005648108.1 pseudouridine synthase [Coccomyxa subellipsoidea C-169]